jgi:hypothetical protein
VHRHTHPCQGTDAVVQQGEQGVVVHVQYVRPGWFQQSGECGPDLGGRTQHHIGPRTVARTESVHAPTPHLGQVREQQRIRQRAHLRHTAHHRSHAVRGTRARAVTGVVTVPLLRTRQFEPEGELDTGVPAVGDLGGPAPQSRQMPGFPTGESGLPCSGGSGGCARQQVGHRVHEQTQPVVRMRQKQRSTSTPGLLERSRVRSGIEGSGQCPYPAGVLLRERPQPPGVEPSGTQAGQQQPSAGHVQGVEGRVAPCGTCRAKPLRRLVEQKRQSVGKRAHHRGNGPPPPSATVRQDHQELFGGSAGRQPPTLGVESDPSAARGVARQEHSRAPPQILPPHRVEHDGCGKG